MKKISTKSGMVRQCGKCNKVHIEVGSTSLKMNINEFFKLGKYIFNLNVEKLIEKKGYGGRVVLALVADSIYMKLNIEQFTDLRLMVEQTVTQLNGELQMSQGDTDFEKFSDIMRSPEFKNLPN
ncbi:MAG: hypothetical protein H8E64_04305 [Candidatus Marinimicrobia bacterium]|nr:hypothetical protein [Candidatus Neomarinimicrobiota bacterium]